MSSFIDLAEIQEKIDNLESLTKNCYQYQKVMIVSIIFFVLIAVVALSFISSDFYTYKKPAIDFYTYKETAIAYIFIGVMVIIFAGSFCIISCINVKTAKAEITPAAKEVIDCVASNEDCSDILIVPDDKGISISFTYNEVHTSIERNIEGLSEKEKTEIVNYANSLFTYKSERK